MADVQLSKGVVVERCLRASAATYQEADATPAGGGGKLGEGVGDAAHSIAKKASGLIAGAGQLASGAGHKASNVAGGVGHAASDAAASAGRMGQSASSGLKTANIPGAVHNAARAGAEAVKDALHESQG